MLTKDQVSWRKPRAGKPNRMWSIAITQFPPKSATTGVLLNRDFSYPDLHWFLNRHWLCTRPSGHCEPCKSGKARESHCYITWLVEGNSTPEILHLSNHLYLSVPDLKNMADLRGVRLCVSRVSESNRGRLAVQYLGGVCKPQELARPYDVDRFILQMYSKQDVTGEVEKEELSL